MNRLIKLFLSLIIICSTIGCDKVPRNGDLDDMWQLMTIEEDGTVTNVKGNQVYWSIRANLIQFNKAGGFRMFGHFERSGNDFIIYDLCHQSNNENEHDNDEWITFDDLSLLAEWGVHPIEDSKRPGRLTQSFKFELLNADNMILKSGKYRLVFRKF